MEPALLPMRHLAHPQDSLGTTKTLEHSRGDSCPPRWHGPGQIPNSGSGKFHSLNPATRSEANPSALTVLCNNGSGLILEADGGAHTLPCACLALGVRGLPPGRCRRGPRTPDP